MDISTINDVTLLAFGGRGDHRGGGAFFGFLLFALGVVAVIAIVRAVQRRRHPELYGPDAWRRRHHRHTTSSAQAILAERFAKGELTADEYDTARHVLDRRDDSDEPPDSA